jgi:hypothetical protein
VAPLLGADCWWSAAELQLLSKIQNKRPAKTAMMKPMQSQLFQPAHLVAAVEHHHVLAQGVAQVLGGLGLARARGAGGRAAQEHAQGLGAGANNTTSTSEAVRQKPTWGMPHPFPPSLQALEDSGAARPRVVNLLCPSDGARCNACAPALPAAHLAERDVADVCEGRDHQALLHTQVLVAA